MSSKENDEAGKSFDDGLLSNQLAGIMGSTLCDGLGLRTYRGGRYRREKDKTLAGIVKLYILQVDSGMNAWINVRLSHRAARAKDEGPEREGGAHPKNRISTN
ncbi:hypothetical protein TESG_08647 [Trichophyton tonsurans CBS 112818]|uniref:Uncharacterized protein n=1 Tax=Trichophyton tonsurans (strain CBS 112818) TaxID=647933 RepID=F2S9X3_TRIT1|nr:hypothetical protein TESG_08647 [Trichophyton tonsurans CBS 112818]